MLHDQKLSEIGALKQKLCTFPAGLFDARLRLATAQERVKALTAEVKDAEMETLLRISSETVANGKAGEAPKARYTNAEQRKAAADQALRSDPAHRERLKRLADAESEAMNAELTVRRLEDEQRAWRAVADITIAEVTLLCHGR